MFITTKEGDRRMERYEKEGYSITHEIFHDRYGDKIATMKDMKLYSTHDAEMTTKCGQNYNIEIKEYSNHENNNYAYLTTSKYRRLMDEVRCNGKHLIYVSLCKRDNTAYIWRLDNRRMDEWKRTRKNIPQRYVEDNTSYSYREVIKFPFNEANDKIDITDALHRHKAIRKA